MSSLVPKTKTNSCNTDLFLETWLYCISNSSQVDDMQNCAKCVESVCRAIYWKTKLDVSCKGWKKSEKMVYLFQYLSVAAHFPTLNWYFLRTLVIPDYAYLQVSSFCPSSLPRISALEEFSIPSRRKTKPKFRGLFCLGVELESSRAQEGFLCAPVHCNWLKFQCYKKYQPPTDTEIKKLWEFLTDTCVHFRTSVVVVSLNPTTFWWPSRLCSSISS